MSPLSLANRLAALAAAALLTACGSTSQHSLTDTTQPLTEFCDRYFIYEMCVKDVNNNGDADVFYFADTNEVFMFREDTVSQIPDELPLHTCAQIMDERLNAVGNDLLQVSEDTTMLQRIELQRRLFVNYSRYKDAINRCNKENGLMMAEDDSFGDEDFEEL